MIVSAISVCMVLSGFQQETIGILNGIGGWKLTLWQGADDYQYITTWENDPDDSRKITYGTVFTLDQLNITADSIPIAESNSISGLTIQSEGQFIAAWIEEGSSKSGDEGVLTRTLSSNLTHIDTKMSKPNSWKYLIAEATVLPARYSNKTPVTYIVTQDIGSGAMRLEAKSAPFYNVTTLFTFPTVPLAEPLRNANNSWTVATENFIHVIYEGFNEKSGKTAIARGSWVLPKLKPVSDTYVSPVHPKLPLVEASGHIVAVSASPNLIGILYKGDNGDFFKIMSEFGTIVYDIPMVSSTDNYTVSNYRLQAFDGGFFVSYAVQTADNILIYSEKFGVRLQPASLIMNSVLVKEFNGSFDEPIGSFDTTLEKDINSVNCIVVIQIGDGLTEVIRLVTTSEQTDTPVVVSTPIPRTLSPTPYPTLPTEAPDVVANTTDNSTTESDSPSLDGSADSDIGRDTDNQAVMIAAAVIIVTSMGVCIYLYLQWRYKEAVNEASKMLIDFEHELDHL